MLERARSAYESKDFEAALELYVNVEPYNLEARTQLARLFGLGPPFGRDEAVRWLQDAAENGHPVAQYALGFLYISGVFGSRERKHGEALFRLAIPQLAAAAESGDGLSMYLLGVCNRRGHGVPWDRKVADQWFLRAASRGVAGAQYEASLALMTVQWLSPANEKPKIQNQWLHLLRAAAEQGHPTAQRELGDRFRDGTMGLPRDRAEAERWYRRAANQGEEPAKRALARLNAEPSGPPSIARDVAHPHQSPRATVPAPSEARRSQGTGWPVAGGYIVTNVHIIEAASTVTLVRQDGTRIAAAVALKDHANDLALLSAVDPSLLPAALPVADRDATLGAQVFTIGFALSPVLGTQPRLTSGQINALVGLQDDERSYQISVPIQLGNSGGPLLNVRGEVVGVVNAKLNAGLIQELTGDIPQNVNFAIKGAHVRSLLESAAILSHCGPLPLIKRAGWVQAPPFSFQVLRASPEYQKATPEVRLKAQERYFRDYVQPAGCTWGEFQAAAEAQAGFRSDAARDQGGAVQRGQEDTFEIVAERVKGSVLMVVVE
jgi:hypothetical protein